MNIKIKQLLKFDNAQKFIQTIQETYFILVVSGVEYMYITAPNGESFEVGDRTLLLLSAGSTIDFRFNEKRCNYTAICEITDFYYDHAANKNSLCGVSGLPLALKLDENHFELTHDIFKKAEKLANSPIARNRTAAEVMLSGALAEFIRHPDRGNANIPQTVLKLREAIDKEITFRRDIGELMSEISCSSGHLRRQFKECFQLSIAEYRSKIRLARIKELMLDYNLSMKEIADLAGMKNVTHLHKFINVHCRMTPRELRSSLGK